MIMKKIYMTPYVKEMAIEEEEMIAASVFDPESDTQIIEISSDDYDGEFCSRGYDIWD